MIAVFEGRDRGAHRAALMLQGGLALFIAGRADSPAAGIDAAGEAIDSGRARRWLERLREFAARRAVAS
jgi:anthranilate phosphoribosyltransferase